MTYNVKVGVKMSTIIDCAKGRYFPVGYSIIFGFCEQFDHNKILISISSSYLFYFSLSAVILAEAVALIAAGTVHRVCITTW